MMDLNLTRYYNMYKAFNFNLLRRNFSGSISCSKNNYVGWSIGFDFRNDKPKRLRWIKHVIISLYKFHIDTYIYRNLTEKEKNEDILKIKIYSTETEVHNGLNSVISFRIPCPCRKSVEELRSDLEQLESKLKGAANKPTIRKKLMKEYQETRQYLDHKEGRMLGSWIFEGTLKKALQEFPDIIRIL